MFQLLLVVVSSHLRLCLSENPMIRFQNTSSSSKPSVYIYKPTTNFRIVSTDFRQTDRKRKFFCPNFCVFKKNGLSGEIERLNFYRSFLFSFLSLLNCFFISKIKRNFILFCDFFTLFTSNNLVNLLQWFYSFYYFFEIYEKNVSKIQI